MAHHTYTNQHTGKVCKLLRKEQVTNYPDDTIVYVLWDAEEEKESRWNSKELHAHWWRRTMFSEELASES